MAQAKVSAAEKTVIILKAAIENRRFTDIVNESGLSKTTVHRILQTLIDYGFVTVTSEGEYIPGPATLTLAGHAFEIIDIAKIATPFIEELAQETGYTVHIGALNGTEAIYVAIENGKTPYRIPSKIGDRLALHSTAIGKILLADFSHRAIENYVKDPGLTPKTPNTHLTLESVLKDLEAIRERGYSFDDEENVPGIRCIGAPIRNHTGKVTHALSVTSLALENSIADIEKLAPLAQATAEKISHALGAPETSH